MPGRSRVVQLPIYLAALTVVGCQAISPPQGQVSQVNQFVHDRAGVSFDAKPLLAASLPEPQPPTGYLTLEDATERALRRNLALVAAAENLTIAHGQLVQAGLIQNPTLAQSSGWLFPLSPAHGFPSIDANITEVVNSIFTQPARVSVARLQEVQADIDLASQAFALAQQVDAKYQELIHLLRARSLAQRITELYARAVRAAEARQKVGVIPTPELNRARLSYEDARRQVQHLTTQYGRAAREMNWLMGYSTAPQWRLADGVVQEIGSISTLASTDELEFLALKYRLDLLRADFDRRVGAHTLELARIGLFPQFTPGFELARDSSKNVVGGPFFSIVLPIFDPGLVAVQLAEAQSRKADKTYMALAGQVRQDVRTAYDNWRIAADDLAFFQQRLIPQQEENVRLMETSFRLGNDDLDSLLNVYQSYVQQLQAFEDAIQAYHDSAVALQQAVGLAWKRILSESHVRPPTRQSVMPTATLPALTLPVTVPAATEPTR